MIRGHGVIAIVVLALLVVALAWVTYSLVAVGQRRRPTHVVHGQGGSVTVAELLADAKREEREIRLDWRERRFEPAALVRPYVRE